MKCVYIKPETVVVAASLISMIAASGGGTQWHEGDDHNPLDPDNPDPNADAKSSSIELWGEDLDSDI